MIMSRDLRAFVGARGCPYASPMVDVIEWPELPAAQQPVWPDAVALEQALAELRTLPPLVFAGECDNLTARLADAAQGRAFVLMGGDCAETFDQASADAIRAKLKTVLQMAIVLTYGASLPVVKIGRMAGQYFKPRSKPFETRDGLELSSYFGDGVNALPFDAASRTPDLALDFATELLADLALGDRSFEADLASSPMTAAWLRKVTPTAQSAETSTLSNENAPT